MTTARPAVLVHTRAELDAARRALPGPVAVVPTMGALHAGHAALIDAAHAECASVITTIFVNPLQFGAGEDLDRYPRTLDADLALCTQHGVHVVWAPAVPDVYPLGGVQVTPDPGPVGGLLEGAVRPGHFAGMLTVVAKLLGLTRADRAYFGQKDYQQLVLVRRMVADLELGPVVVGVPTVREPDGLALSSRNVYLSPAGRTSALALSRGLRAGASVAAQGGAAADVLAAARAVLDAEPGVVLDYLELRTPELDAVPTTGPGRLLVAARVEGTRLIDNAEVALA